MKPTKEMQISVKTNRIILGLLMLIPGLSKLFIMKPAGVSEFLASLSFPLPMFFAIILIASEIVFGLLIITNKEMRLATIPPMIILFLAGVLVALPAKNWPLIMMHLALIANYWVFSAWDNRKM